MIRYLTILFILCHVSFSLVSCSLAPTSDEDASNAPIEDEESASVGNDGGSGDEVGELSESGTEPTDQASTSGEDELESELDSSTDEKTAKNDTANDSLDGELSESDLETGPPAEKEEVPSTVPAPAPEVAKEEKAKVRDIRYMSNANGGTVVIETDKPISYQTRLNASTQQFVIEMANVELPPALQRPYLTKDFNSKIGSINAYQGSGSDTARVVIQLNGKVESEPVVQQEGASLVVIPPAPQAVAQQAPPAPTPEKPRSEGALSAHTLDEFLTGNQKFYGRPISLQVKDADVRDVVNFLAEESGANIVMSEDVKGRISIKLRRVPWDQALVTVMRTKDLGYVRQGNVLRISTLKELQGETEAANKIIEAQKAIVPSVVQVIPVSYANMDDLTKNLAPFLSKDGKVVADNRSNTLIVTDKAEVVERVQKLVKTLDIPPAQVSIEAKIVEALEQFDAFAGITWNFGGADVTLSNNGGAQGAPVNLNWATKSASLSKDFSGAGPFTSTLRLGTVDILGDLAATLVLAEKEALAKVVSAPRISSMNREKSTIMQKGENVSVITTRSEQTGLITKQEKRTPFSLQLDVTPQITADGSVIMDLDVKREFLGPVVDAELQSRAVNTRTAHSKILVRTGQTAVIGGIYTSEESEATNGIPGLMHIPILGWLFKNRSTNRAKNELLIFLTPRIMAQQEKAQTISSQ